MAEDAASADLLAGGRLQLGISRGSPEPALHGSHAFGHVPADGETDADLARRHTERFRAAIAGEPVVTADARMAGGIGRLAIQPQSPGLSERIWWGAGTRETGVWTARQGMNLMSSTLLSEDTGVPFDQLQAEQIQMYLDTWREAGWERRPRISVSRSVIPIVTDTDDAYFGGERGGGDQVGYLDGGIARFGKSYTGEPDRIAVELAEDAAVAMADTVLMTVPNQLGVDYNAELLRNIAEHVAPAIGWSPAGDPGSIPAGPR
jgi:alkanesulfonate monooxygenase SsuD/methylene tetrahydromethanopterin reductase-like flavin-dependent oxidoreductase (luciferase family)